MQRLACASASLFGSGFRRQAFSLYEADGSLRCQWKQFQHQTIKVSANGKWLGNLIFGKVDLWPLDSLADFCTGLKH